MTVSGLALLYTAVTHLGFNKFLAQMVFVPAVMAVVSYIVHRFVTFGDHKQLNEHEKVRYAAVRAGGMGLSKVAFVLLVAVVGVQYLLASLLITLSLAGPSYLLTRNWAFAQSPVRQSERV